MATGNATKSPIVTSFDEQLWANTAHFLIGLNHPKQCISRESLNLQFQDTLDWHPNAKCNSSDWHAMQ